jgi:hypothetical protein
VATTYKGAVSTFRTAGLASANHNIFTIFNKTGSAKFVKLKRLTVQTEATAVLITVAPIIVASRITTLPTGGTVLTKVPYDTTLTADANVELMGATASDGGAASTITSTAGTRLWAAFKSRLHTAVGQVLMFEQNLIPDFCDVDPIILRATQGINVQVVQAALTTDHYIVTCAWEETDSIP